MLDWNNRQNGALIGGIGVVSALLQGGYVRRAMSRTGEGAMARRGVAACALGLVLLAALPHVRALRVLQGAAVCLAFTSATVVNSLTAYASLQCDEAGVDGATGKARAEHPELAKGKALGKFRSSGQLGRALGPLLGELFAMPCRCRCADCKLACASYWTFGPSTTYGMAAGAMVLLSSYMRTISPKTKAVA